MLSGSSFFSIKRIFRPCPLLLIHCQHNLTHFYTKLYFFVFKRIGLQILLYRTTACLWNYFRATGWLPAYEIYPVCKLKNPKSRISCDPVVQGWHPLIWAYLLTLNTVWKPNLHHLTTYAQVSGWGRVFSVQLLESPVSPRGFISSTGRGRHTEMLSPKFLLQYNY